MKKVFGIIFALLATFVVIGLTNAAKAEEVLGDEMINNGSFTTNVQGGVAAIDSTDSFAGGDWGANHVFLAEDPESDIAIRMDYGPADNMYIMVPVDGKAGDIVNVSLDYYVVGTCTNFGLGFWCTTKNARLLEHVVTDKPNTGWEHAEWSYEAFTEDLVFDSIHAWTLGQTEGSQVYFKNLTVTVNESDENLVAFGNLSWYEDELVDGEILLNACDSIAAGDWSAGHTYAALDPIKDVTLRMDYMAGRDNMFIMVPVKTEIGESVKVSMDYMVKGTCTNFGLGFWCTTKGARLLEMIIEEDTTDGWVHAEWEYEEAVEVLEYDSIHCWCLGQTEGSQTFIKNLKVTVGESENLVVSGDLNQFKNLLVSDEAKLGATADKFGNVGENASYTGTTVKIENGYFAQNGDFKAGKYQVSVDAPEGAVVAFYNGETVVAVVEDGGTVTTSSDSDSIRVTYAGVGEIDNLSVKAYEEKAVSFEGYYQSATTTVNGDFEKFDEGTVLTEAQLEGAWGSVSLDAPGKIVKVGDTKAIQIATDATHKYSSCFLMLPDTLEVGDILRVQYDAKVELVSEYILLNSCFVGGSNVSYYEIPLMDIVKAGFTGTFKTSGAEKVNYPITITAKENGWYTISVDLQITANDLIQTNSIRWLLSSENNDDKLFIDNVNIYFLTEEEPEQNVEVSTITIAEGSSITMKAGEEKNITVTVQPENATDKTVTYETSNAAVATVDENGKIKAVGKGACSITVKSANGKTAEIAVVVTEEKKGCFSMVSTSIVSVIALAGAALVSYKKNKENE